METIKIPVQHWITYLFGRVGGVGRGKRQICASKPKSKSILEWFCQKVFLSICVWTERSDYQE